MKYAISNWIYGQEAIEKTFERLAKYRYDGLEIKGEPENYDIKQLGELMESYNIKTASVCGMWPWDPENHLNTRDLANPDPKVREKGIKYAESALEFAKRSHAVCFGTLAQRSETSYYSIQEILKTVPDNALKVFDINMRQHFYNEEIIIKSLEKANILKINEDEILVFADMFNISGDEFEVIHQIIQQYNLKLLALTKGDHGSWLISDQENSYLDTPSVSVADTVGAGDSFTAALVAGILKGKPLKEVHQNAVDVSAFVCTQKGATPILPEDLT